MVMCIAVISLLGIVSDARSVDVNLQPLLECNGIFQNVVPTGREPNVKRGFVSFFVASGEEMKTKNKEVLALFGQDEFASLNRGSHLKENKAVWLISSEVSDRKQILMLVKVATRKSDGAVSIILPGVINCENWAGCYAPAIL